jgi:predicted aldo/keto reductase-like oxidoreductase
MLLGMSVTTESKMLYRRFGRTELQMPVFSCGGMRYQDGWKDKPLDEVEALNQQNLEQTIDRALQLGINHIETARGYGPSERQLGCVLPRLPRDQIIVQTKTGPKEDPAAFREEFEDSLDRLQLDHVDLFAIHGINNRAKLEWTTKRGGCFEVAQQFREEGKCRFVGFSTHGPPDVIAEAIAHGEPETGKGFDYINLHWYYILQRNWPAIEQASERDMGVFIISPSDKGGKLYAPSDKLTELCRPLHPIVFNDLFCLSHPQVHTLSIGAARPSDFALHIETLAYMDRADELLPIITERLEQALDEAAPPDLRDPFNAGFPEWDGVPGGVNVQNTLWLLNLARAWDLTTYAKWRYNLMGNGGDWMPGYKCDKLDEDDNEAKLRDLIADHPAGVDKVVSLLRQAHDLLGGQEARRLQEEG